MKLCLSSVKTLHVGKFAYPSGNNGFLAKMKQTLNDFSQSAASPMSPDAKVDTRLDLETRVQAIAYRQYMTILVYLK